MKITVIHGQSHKGSTYNITKQIIDKILDTNKEIYEYFMPRDTPNYCIGCYNCFNESENSCPQAEKVQKIVKSMEISDIIVIDSPTYCFEMTGQLKTLFDHFGYMWLSHRPKQVMFNKVGIVISTAAGAGARKVTKALAQQMFWLGIPKVFQYSKNVSASNWEMVPNKVKKSIEHDISKLSTKVQSKVGKVSPNFRLKFIFTIMGMMQKSNNWNKVDQNYWKENGWLDKKTPW
ncbi:NAD(P)H-dependent oxidoreductase [Tissierella sp. DSM 105185]|uniref:NAD(P)H-dependent oxidoreductase n=1 Tax=Tissierella pigra TaxID=2607614 RepID=A0A6N7XY77_9FIRM|nr:NAD(P)H-dependent oxidoreductase [Tissierella pigra]